MFNKKIILASASPRRAEILKMAGIEFDVRASNIEEIVNPKLTPLEIVKDIAAQKTLAIHNPNDESITLGADTIVVLEGHILGKPKNLEEAKLTLRKLSERVHEVITGVAIFKGEEKHVFAESTKVYFNHLSDEQIDYYIKNDRPLDKAGSYAIQEYIGAVGIEKIDGDYYNVVGLPIQRLVSCLSEHFTS